MINFGGMKDALYLVDTILPGMGRFLGIADGVDSIAHTAMAVSVCVWSLLYSSGIGDVWYC